MTNVDKALLLAEWGVANGDCPVCKKYESDGHGIDCAVDLALGERGFYTREERDRARGFITQVVATAPTLPPEKS